MTDQIKHHLTDALLMAYSAGNLPEAFNLAVATHVSMCDECRARLGAFDSLGGALVEETDAVEVSAGCLDAVMERLKISARTDEKPSRTNSIIPAPLQDYIGNDLDSVQWKSIGMGVKQAVLPTSHEASARLLFIPAGTAVPDHGHNGTELTLVLKGAFADAVDHFGVGDIEIANEDLDHTPIADIGEDCICLAATDAPLKFKGLIPRLAQPFLRI
jgi:putative transcriptional regulator